MTDGRRARDFISPEGTRYGANLHIIIQPAARTSSCGNGR